MIRYDPYLLFLALDRGRGNWIEILEVFAIILFSATQRWLLRASRVCTHGAVPTLSSNQIASRRLEKEKSRGIKKKTKEKKVALQY